ncbi:NUDIX domain-containing protein [Myceligenerans sp. I2]|uniref:NUDIX domain-containing protein n=1 Tax=Myceligenerans indicum TaxID=2593663 RepID=A0ABS1LGK8_9MICO|nr:NUDIX domain-containing protein [Myceligenerans indicum]
MVVRRAARAILLDDEGRLVLIKRTLPDRPDEPYWVTPGGGVEPEDMDTEEACLREVHEELGATASLVRQVYFTARPREEGFATHHYFLARLKTMDVSLRHGPEFDKPDRGSYDVELINLRNDGNSLDRIRLVPSALKMFLQTNRGALLAEAGLDLA